MSKKRKNTSSDHLPADRTFWDIAYPKYCNVFLTGVVSLAENPSKNAGKCQWPLRVSDVLASMEPYFNARRELEKQIRTKTSSSSGAGLEWAPSFETDERWVLEQLQKAEPLSEIISDCFNIEGHQLDWRATPPLFKSLVYDACFRPHLLFFAFKERPDLAAAVRPKAIDRVSQKKVDLLFKEKKKPPPFGTAASQQNAARELLMWKGDIESLLKLGEFPTGRNCDTHRDWPTVLFENVKYANATAANNCEQTNYMDAMVNLGNMFWVEADFDDKRNCVRLLGFTLKKARPGATATARQGAAKKFCMGTFLRSYSKSKIEIMLLQNERNQSAVARIMFKDAETKACEQGVTLTETAFDYLRQHVGRIARKMKRLDLSRPPK